MGYDGRGGRSNPTYGRSLTLAGVFSLAAVTAALAQDERTCDTEFHVSADNGVVTIEGMAKLPDMVASVSAVAAKVGGVVKVVNQVVTFGISA